MTQALTKESLNNVLSRMHSQMKMALPEGVTPEQIHRVVLTEVSKNPAILKCTRDSVLRSVMEACQLGLVPNSTQGLAYLVPYKQTCQLIPGFKGLIKLALQSGHVTKIWARVVYSNDFFEYEEGLYPKLIHRPGFEPGAELVGVYAVAKMRGEEEPQFLFLPRAQVDRIKNRSASVAQRNKGPWIDDYEAMAQKTAIRALCKTLPLESEKLSVAVQRREGPESGLEYDIELQDYVFVEGEESEEGPPGNSTEAINAELQQKPSHKAARPPAPLPAWDLKSAEGYLREAMSLEKLKECYTHWEKEWAQALGPEKMCELDEVYQGLKESFELEAQAA